ncbi:hypothetical protein U1Q18_043397, partial [Sarracenia purpurea var. burkii]
RETVPPPKLQNIFHCKNRRRNPTLLVGSGDFDVIPRPAMESHGTGLRRVLVLTFCVVGIWSAYICQGLLQEIVGLYNN